MPYRIPVRVCRVRRGESDGPGPRRRAVRARAGNPFGTPAGGAPDVASLDPPTYTSAFLAGLRESGYTPRLTSAVRGVLGLCQLARPLRDPPMLVRLHKDLNAREREAAWQAIRELGLEPRALDEAGTVVALSVRGTAAANGFPNGATNAGASAPPAAALRSQLADLTAVAAVLDAGDAHELAERGGRADTVVHVGEASFGGGHVALLAGPCAVEDPARLREIADSVRASGATALRAGAYKPRSSPYSFQGLGPVGLELLAEVRLATGMAVVTEVLDARDIEAVDQVCDMFQVGSRNMSNVTLLRELGQTRKPVLLKRGMAATAREFLLAAEYVLVGGNEKVVLCERGIRGFDGITRNVLDLGTVAWLKRASHLPVIADPSHAAGRRDLVRPLGRAALAAGADGLIVEVHPCPSEVHSDGEQALSLEAFRELADDARALCALDGRRLATSDPVRLGSDSPADSPRTR